METATAVIAEGQMMPVEPAAPVVAKAITGAYIAQLLEEMGLANQRHTLLAEQNAMDENRAKLQVIFDAIFPMDGTTFGTVLKEFKKAREEHGYKDAGPRASELKRIYGAHKYVMVRAMDADGNPVFDDVAALDDKNNPITEATENGDTPVMVQKPRMVGWKPSAAQMSWNKAAAAAKTVLDAAGKTPTGGTIVTDAQRLERKAEKTAEAAREAVGFTIADLAKMTPAQQAETLSKFQDAVAETQAAEAFESLEKDAERRAKALMAKWWLPEDRLDVLTLIARHCGYTAEFRVLPAQAE